MKEMKHAAAIYLIGSSLLLGGLALGVEGQPDEGLTEASLKGKSTVQVLMQNKLVKTQDLFGAMIAKDFEKMRRSAEILQSISKVTEWHRSSDPEFVNYAQSFQRAANDILQQISNKNIEGIGLSYIKLTLACMTCHGSLRFSDAKSTDAKAKIDPVAK